MRSVHLGIGCLTLLLGASPVFGQALLDPLAAPEGANTQIDPRNSRIQQLSLIGAATHPDYQLGPGDVIDVSVFGVPEYRHSVTINSDGMIRPPLLDPVEVVGSTTSELERRLETLLEGNLIRNPDVSVLVSRHRSRTVFVLGAVRSPGEYQLTRSLQLVDILALAGGLTPNAGLEAAIQRRSASSPAGTGGNAGFAPAAPEVIRIDLEQLLDGNHPEVNIAIGDGDVVQVVERRVKWFYVIGDVNMAGAFQMPDHGALRLSQAVAQAGGTMRTAKLSGGLLMRYDPVDGTREEIELDLKKIYRGQQDDVTMRPEDIVFVPGSGFKTFSYGLLGSIPSAVARMPIDIARIRR